MRVIGPENTRKQTNTQHGAVGDTAAEGTARSGPPREAAPYYYLIMCLIIHLISLLFFFFFFVFFFCFFVFVAFPLSLVGFFVF